MKTTVLMLATLIFPVATAMAQDPNGFMRVNYDCDSVSNCACYEACTSVCRIVNGVQVCDESCTTICDYAKE
ncbi:MAG TPA: hypothetical protein VJB59_09475 [Bdellovibrionota bacterium]|nr:hypothetical protein [Bdellovibrionota bacterium]